MYYKILPADCSTFGYQYKMGVNRMDHPEDFGKRRVSNDGCDNEYDAGLYFADGDLILQYCYIGDCIADVEIADGAKLECWGDGEYSTDALEILNIRPLWSVDTLKELEREGVSIPDSLMLSWAKELGKNDEVIQWLTDRLDEE